MAKLDRVPTDFSYSLGVEAGDFIFLSSHRGFGDNLKTHFGDAVSRLGKTLLSFDVPFTNLVQTVSRCRETKDLSETERLLQDILGKDTSPARSGSITGFIDDNTLFSISGIACSKELKMTGIKRITTPFSYSLAVAAGDFVFLGLHRGFGDDFTTQFDNTMARLEKTLAEFDMKLEHLVKINVWLKDIQDVRVYEQLFRNYFEEGKYPARMGSTTGFIDDDCLLMIDGIVYRG